MTSSPCIKSCQALTQVFPIPTRLPNINSPLLHEHLFIGHGLTVIARNYLEVYPYDKWSDKEIADYESIKQFQPTSIDLVHGETEPPQLLTEADLIALMDKHGIGIGISLNIRPDTCYFLEF